jgi:DNA-binding GntR family transcriptional regulator
MDAPNLSRSSPLRNQIYHFVRGMIVNGQMRPGEAINEILIAEQLGVSRTPVREAVKRISDEGLVNVFPQTGTFVAKISLRQLEEAYIIRSALELESVKRAASRFTTAHAESLQDNIAAYELAISRAKFIEAISLDDVFHRTIAETNDFQMLWRAVDISKAQMDRCRHLAIPKPGNGQLTIQQHKSILRALQRHDEAGAAAAMHEHLKTSLRNALEVTTAESLD